MKDAASQQYKTQRKISLLILILAFSIQQTQQSISKENQDFLKIYQESYEETVQNKRQSRILNFDDSNENLLSSSNELSDQLNHIDLKQGIWGLQVLDYVLAALNGLQSEKYVPNSKACVNNTKYFQIDTQTFMLRYNNQPDDSLETKEGLVFNATATVSGYLPNAIYFCYFIPQTSLKRWTAHYEEFESLQDFEGAFIQNIAGNMLTFINIYNQTVIASRNGDFLVVIEQMARFVRRLIDFRSMQRETLVKSLDQMQYYVRLLAQGPIVSANSTSLNRTDIFSRLISSFTGFVDGSFRAKNISMCRASLILFANSIQNLSTAISANNENRTVFYATRALKYVHPSAFHCYYSGKETAATYQQYREINSPKDVSYNAIYKTGQMTDQIRIIQAMMNLAQYTDRQLYVIFRGIGTIINVLLSPFTPRKEY
eukprot:403340092